MVSITLISNLSEKIQLEKLSKFLKSGITWSLGIIVSIFVSVLSLEGSLASGIDGITAKGVKGLASNLIPVVGKALSDSADMVLGATLILKNSIGIIGIIIIVGICIIPIIKLSALIITYYLAQAICEPLADKRIVSLLGQMGSSFKILLGIMFFVSVLIIIGVAMCMKISNTQMMYR